MALPCMKRKSVWCPRCRDFEPAWVIEGVPHCLQCGRQCPEHDVLPVREEQPDSTWALISHRYCWTCGRRVDNPWLLIHPPGEPAAPTISQWLCLQADALIELPVRTRDGGRMFRDGPVARWRIWCPRCMTVRMFHCELETIERRPPKPPKSHEFERDPKMFGQKAFTY